MLDEEIVYISIICSVKIKLYWSNIDQTSINTNIMKLELVAAVKNNRMLKSFSCIVLYNHGQSSQWLSVQTILLIVNRLSSIVYRCRIKCVFDDSMFSLIWFKNRFVTICQFDNACVRANDVRKRTHVCADAFYLCTCHC